MTTPDASLPLQRAIVARCAADAGVQALIGDANGPSHQRFYDAVPATAAKPYVSFGPDQLLAEPADEYDGADLAVQLDAWSAGPGRVQVKQIIAALWAALDRAPLALEGHRLITLDVEQTRILPEPDGTAWHGVLILRARTEPID
jgi:hypothetical protein